MDIVVVDVEDQWSHPCVHGFDLTVSPHLDAPTQSFQALSDLRSGLGHCLLEVVGGDCRRARVLSESADQHVCVVLVEELVRSWWYPEATKRTVVVNGKMEIGGMCQTKVTVKHFGLVDPPLVVQLIDGFGCLLTMTFLLLEGQPGSLCRRVLRVCSGHHGGRACGNGGRDEGAGVLRRLTFGHG